MSILDKNITEEEKLSGYSPSEKEDETFMLSNIDAYPGSLPDFSYEEEPLIPGEGTFLDDDEEEFDSFDDLDESDNLDEEASQEEDDNFNFDTQETQNENDIVQNENDIVVGAFEDSDEDLVSDFTEYDDESTFDDDDSDDIKDDDDSSDSFNFGDDDKIEELSDEEIRALEGGEAGFDNELENQTNQDNIDLGDDLKSVLKNDLKKSQIKKGNDFNFDDEIEVVSDEGFPIDDELNADVVNFNDLELDKPSNYGIDKLEDEKESESIKDENERKEDNRLSKKMIYIYSGVAVLLLATLLITAIMNKESIFNDIPNDEDSTLVENNSKLEKLEKNTPKNLENKITKEKSKTEYKNEIKKSNESKVDDFSQKYDKPLFDSSISSNSLSNNSSNIINEKEIENKNEKNTKISTKSPKLKYGTNKKDLVISDPVVPNNNKVKTDKVDTDDKKTISKQKRINDKANNQSNVDKVSSSKSKDKDIASNNTSKENKNIFKNESASVVPYPRKSQSDEGLFIVQVYASQSKEDALSWLEKLKEQDINDAFISEQIIRDEIWYRVRFGNFTNKNEALEKAAKLGYAQTWVDRVK